MSLSKVRRFSGPGDSGWLVFWIPARVGNVIGRVWLSFLGADCEEVPFRLHVQTVARGFGWDECAMSAGIILNILIMK